VANFSLDHDFVKDAENRAKAHKSKPTDNLVMANVRVPEKLRDRLRIEVVDHDRSNTSIIEEALENWLEKSEK
jgi:hypothetical protein